MLFYYKFIIMFHFYLFIVIYPRKSVMITCVQCCLNKDQSFITLTSCIRLYLVYMF
jgi:hypothetical protein